MLNHTCFLNQKIFLPFCKVGKMTQLAYLKVQNVKYKVDSNNSWVTDLPILLICYPMSQMFMLFELLTDLLSLSCHDIDCCNKTMKIRYLLDSIEPYPKKFDNFHQCKD